MIKWNILQSLEDLESVVKRSEQVPCLIFKHSTRCSISSMAKMRLEQNWDFSPDALEPYYLDLIQHRNVSNTIAERFDVFHESPQVLLIQGGECIYDASHLDISVEELHEVFQNS